MTNTEMLLASLTTLHTTKTLDVADGYVDWSTRDGSRYCLEVSDGTDTAGVWVTRDEMLKLHQALTLALLEDADA
jgi:hypothetical protein